MSTKTYLITGAAGFIASQTVKLLINEGHKVIGIDNLNDYYDTRLKEYRLSELQKLANFSFFKIDIENQNELQEIFEKYNFDAVLNLAARAGVRYSIDNPYVYLSTNANGTLNILELMKDYKIKKLVLASTSSLYAGQEMPFKEDLAVNTPISPYSASKKAAEAMCYAYHHCHDIDVSVVRYFTVFGPAGRPDMCIFRFIKNIESEGTIEIYGDGSQARDFTYVDDIARGTISALKSVGYEIFNLGGGNNPVSLMELISKIENITGKKAKIKYLPFAKGDFQVNWADISKAKKFFDWSPITSLDEGLKKTVEWHIENRNFVNELS